MIGAAAFLSAAPLNATLVQAAGSWTMTASGPAVAESAVVPMGKLPSVTVLATSIKVEWAPSMYPTGKEVNGYLVRRRVVGNKDMVQVCTAASPIRACEDSPPAGQAVVYTIVPTEQLWRGPASVPSNPVTLPAPTLAVTAPLPSATPSPSPTASATPSATASPISTPSPTATPSPTPNATPAPTPTATPTPAPS
jgi:hypothetical protein